MKHMILFFLLFSVISADIFAAATGVCPQGFSMLNKKKCVKVFFDYVKHLEAEERCAGYGGSLVNIHNAIDNRAVATFAANSATAYYWIGVYCFGNTTADCFLDDGSGSTVKYHNFAPGYPKLDQDRRGCVFAPSWGSDMGQWQTGPCEWTGLGSVCEAPMTIADTSCTHNYNGHCYFPSNELPIPQINRTYLGARDICHTYSMKPVSIHSRNELDFIRSIYNNTGIKQVSLGAQASQPDTFEWADGTKFDYGNFDPLSRAKGSCLQMDLSDRLDTGMWTQTNCQMIPNFMCKRKAGAVSGVVEVEENREINPKFKIVKSENSDLSSQVLDLSDASHCNSTIFIGPGFVTSFGYNTNPAPSAYCTWNLAVLGPYRLGLYFTDFSVSSSVDIYNGNGTLIASVSKNKDPFSVLAPYNMVTMIHDSSSDGSNSYHGFSATILPY